MAQFHPVASYLDTLFWMFEEVAVCGPVIRYTRKMVRGKCQRARITYSNAFDPLARHWKTEEAALNFCFAKTKERVEV